MKLSVALCLLLCAVCCLNAAVGYKFVQVHHYNSAVSRVVVSFTEKAVPTISKSANSLEIQLKDFNNSSAAPVSFRAGGVIARIEQNGSSLQIITSEPFRYEQLNLNRHLSLDFFVANPTKAQRLEIADFYFEKGKLNSADKAYSDLHIDYREDGQILYHWAELLVQRGSSRAAEKLDMIPSSSSYFRKAQTLLTKLRGDEAPLLPSPPITEEANKVEVEQPTPLPVEPVDSIIHAPAQAQAQAQAQTDTPPPITKMLLSALPLVAAEAALLVILVYLISLALKAPKHKKYPKHKAIKTDDIAKTDSPGLDTNTQCRMVSKLLADGWTLREISKELKISLKEVENLVQLCHHGGYD